MLLTAAVSQRCAIIHSIPRSPLTTSPEISSKSSELSPLGSCSSRISYIQIAKQEEWEERNKLGNQFRALEEDEVMFLDSIREAQYEEERKLKEQEGVELKGFRAYVNLLVSSCVSNMGLRSAVAARTTIPPPNPVPPSDPAPKPKAAPLPSKPAPRKDAKKSLKGVIVRKKPKVVVKEPSPKLEATKDESDEPPAAKKRKV